MTAVLLSLLFRSLSHTRNPHKLGVPSSEGIVKPASIVLPAHSLVGAVNRQGVNLTKEDNMSEGKVLVVDDEADVRKSVRLILSKAGYDVIEAEDGEVGVSTIKSGDNPFSLDAIICDLNMPKMSGMEAIPYFRSQFPSCPVIVLTGAGSVDRATTLFKQGVIEFLSKPIDRDKLLGAVKKAVSEGGWKDDFRA